jgi:hypothetical protein
MIIAVRARIVMLAVQAMCLALAGGAQRWGGRATGRFNAARPKAWSGGGNCTYGRYRI